MENTAGIRGTVHDAIASGGAEDVLALQDLDPALNMKMHLVNNVRTRARLDDISLHNILTKRSAGH